MLNSKEKLMQEIEEERQKLHSLIEKDASKEEIQRQSEILDKYIAKCLPRQQVKINYQL